MQRLTTNFVHDSTVRYFQMFLILCKFSVAVAHSFLTWVFSVRSLSSHAPRYLTKCDLHIVSPSIFSPTVMHLLACILLPKIMNSDLELFIFSLTEFIHVLMLSKLLTNRPITYFSSVGRLGLDSLTIASSSANAIRLRPRSNALLMVLLYMLKLFAPEQDPCSTEKVSSFFLNMIFLFLYPLELGNS